MSSTNCFAGNKKLAMVQSMRILVVVLLTWFSFHVAAATLEEIAPRFSPNAEIVWSVPSNDLPKRLWVYRKLPHVFTAATISNAVILAGFQQKGIPKPSTNVTVMWDEIAGSTVGEPRPPCFAITPEDGMIQFDLGDRWPNSAQDILADQTEVEYAWSCLAWLGVDRTQFVKTNVTGNGVSFPRQIDGIRFPDETEGFSIQRYGKERKLRFFLLTLPNLQRTTNSPTASPQEIIGEEADYLSRVKAMAKAKKLAITKLTPYYGEGVYGEEPPNNRRPSWVMPVAYLEATATFGASNATVKLYAPILTSDVLRLLGNKQPRHAK
jgi:hypothetical protein